MKMKAKGKATVAKVGATDPAWDKRKEAIAAAVSRLEAEEGVYSAWEKWEQTRDPKWLRLLRAIRASEKYWECV